MSEEKTTSKLSGEDMSVVSGGRAVDPVLIRESDPMQFINPIRTEDTDLTSLKMEKKPKTGDP